VSVVRLVSSIGKKELVAITGLVWLGFLAGHLLGNLSIFFGAPALDKYGEHLHGLGIILSALEAGLLVFLLAHICLALWVTLENFFARPVRYQGGRKNKAGWASKLMPYTGITMLVFIVTHLIHFRFQRGLIDDSVTTSRLFTDPGWTVFYVISVAVVSFHVVHGFWSGFHTLGLGMANRETHRYIRNASLVFSLIVGIGFGILPIVVFVAHDYLGF
jgi:succinate dehydrogenase / fumarate reductase, cytochrome b subunit